MRRAYGDVSGSVKKLIHIVIRDCVKHVERTFYSIWPSRFKRFCALLAYFVFVIVVYDAINSAVSNAYYALLPECL